MTLEGVKAIANCLEVSPRRIRFLVVSGAPIRQLGEGQRGVRYMADKETLLQWLRCERSGRPRRAKAG